MSDQIRSSRRAILAGGAAAVGGVVIGAGDVGAAAPTGRGAASAPRSGEDGGGSLLDRIVSDGSVRVGVDLGFAPLQYRDEETNEPTGYSIELTKLMMAELGAEIEYVEIPFSELFAAGEAGRFDISGIQATNLPARGLRVAFAGAPAFLEGNYVMLQPESDGDEQRRPRQQRHHHRRARRLVTGGSGQAELPRTPSSRSCRSSRPPSRTSPRAAPTPSTSASSVSPTPSPRASCCSTSPRRSRRTTPTSCPRATSRCGPG